MSTVKQPKAQTQEAKYQENCRENKMIKEFVLLYLLCNIGLDFLANFTKRDCSIAFFYICKYSLERLGDHPRREEIKRILDEMLNDFRTLEMKPPAKQNRIANVLVQLCQLLGVQLTVIPRQNPNAFPKVSSIRFGNKSFSPSEFAEAVDIQTQLANFMNRIQLNKKQHLICLSSLANDAETVEQLKQNVNFNVVQKSQVDTNATEVSLTNIMNGDDNENENTIIETPDQTEMNIVIPNQPYFIFTGEVQYNNTTCRIYYDNCSNWCFIVEPNGNNSYHQYMISENNHFYFFN